MAEDKVIPVRVAVRSRPLIPKETNEGCQICLSFTPGEPQIILGKDRAFTYDYVFSQTNGQTEVYDGAVHPLIKNIFRGYNATVLAYGQTGSGKTFTMGGCYESSLREDETEMGVIPRVLRELFSGIEKIEDTEFSVKVSYLEIHNEDINDLLCPASKREPLAIREDLSGEIRLPGLREVEVKTFQETMSCLEKGSHGRTTGSTAMNTHSSRSHAIFTITIEQRKKEDMDDVCKSKFHLVDLAGSERAKRTQAVGERFKEGVNINRGLLALGNVISALGEEAQSRSHIPYRDSKLTRLLQDSLGGNSYTLMIACVSPADSNMEETLNTLRYADRARKIKNKPIVNRDPQAAEIHRLKQVVQQLQVQLINGGIGISTSCASSTMSIESSTEELKNLIEKNKLLEDENSKLSEELGQAVDQSTNMCEKAIKLELKCDRLKTRLTNLKKDTGVDFDVLSTSVDLDSNPTARAQFDKLKLLVEKMNTEESEEEKDSPLTTIEEEEDNSDTALPGTPDSRAMSKEYALRQAKMNRELQELNKLLSKKEVLANQMSENDEKMHSMRQQYETQMKDLELEISLLQKEKETMQNALDDAKTNSNANKVAEQRRVRLKELEQQISQLRKKMSEQARMLKMKDTSDKQVSKLNTDIQALKSQRIKLVKQMKEDADEFRRWKQKKDKEVMQLMQKDRKRQFEIVKLQRENQKQQTVLKRKSEEAAAANRRLKEALVKQKQVHAERSQKLEKYDSTSIGNRVRSWLSHELEVRVSIREAKYHLESLLTDRKTLCQQRKELKEKVEDETDGPPIKKLAWLAENGDKTECSFEIEEIKKEISILDQEISLRNAQISDLQQKIVDADQDIKGKSTWESVHTMVEAKCALKWLLEQAVSAKADNGKLQGELKDSQYSHDDNKELLDRLEKELGQCKKQHEQELTKLQKQHEEKVLFLLRQMKTNKDVPLQGDVKDRIKLQEEEIEKLSHLHEELQKKSEECEALKKVGVLLQKKSEECEALKKQMTVAMYQNKTMPLLPSIDDPGASPFLSPKPKKKIKHAKRKVPEHTMSYQEYIELEESEESPFEDNDDDKDEDWRMTPLAKQRKTTSVDNNTTTKQNTSRKEAESQAQKIVKKNSSSSLFCKCKLNCGSRKCSCRNKGNNCSDECGCDSSKCKNRELQEPNSTTYESDEENESVSTLNSTYNLREKEENEISGVEPINEALPSDKSNRLIKPINYKDDPPSSDEFMKPSLVSKKNRSVDPDSSTNSSGSVDGGLKKKKRKLLNSNSFFSPLV